VIVDAGVDPTSDLDGLAALIASLDLVITVSNTTAHLAGALGIPVWTLVPRGAGALWYWFDPSPPWQVAPWYPAMRLYPQSVPGAWEPVIDRVAADLTAVCTAAART
jgi:ADP-heptose:LPS heptosyltransferase